MKTTKTMEQVVEYMRLYPIFSTDDLCYVREILMNTFNLKEEEVEQFENLYLGDHKREISNPGCVTNLELAEVNINYSTASTFSNWFFNNRRSHYFTTRKDSCPKPYVLDDKDENVWLYWDMPKTINELQGEPSYDKIVKFLTLGANPAPIKVILSSSYNGYLIRVVNGILVIGQYYKHSHLYRGNRIKYEEFGDSLLGYQVVNKNSRDMIDLDFLDEVWECIENYNFEVILEEPKVISDQYKKEIGL